MEHYQLNKDKTDIMPNEPVDVKSRTYSQYYLGSALSLVISVLLFFFFIRGKDDEASESYNKTISLENLDIQQQNIMNQTNTGINSQYTHRIISKQKIPAPQNPATVFWTPAGELR